ncbi:MAG: hypothetical protein ACI9CD_001088, partial [Candidatus Deianiraeaceae bacterium]
MKYKKNERFSDNLISLFFYNMQKISPQIKFTNRISLLSSSEIKE